LNNGIYQNSNYNQQVNAGLFRAINKELVKSAVLFIIHIKDLPVSTPFLIIINAKWLWLKIMPMPPITSSGDNYTYLKAV